MVNTVTLDSSLSLSTTSPSSQSSSGSVYPISDYLSSHKFSDQHRSFLVAISSHHIPKSFKEAILDKIWKDSMGSEVTALESQHTWDVVPLPPGKKPLENKWLYTIKYRSDGSIERPKSR